MARRPRLPELAAALAVAALAGCGGDGNVLTESASALDDVTSGILSLKVVIEPSGGAGEQPFGFELKGPFELGETPVAQMTYTQIANGRRGVAKLVLNADGGYVETNGARRTLTAGQLTQLRGATRTAAEGGGLQLDDWATSTDQRDCGDGQVCVDGELDATKAIVGLTRLQREVGVPGPQVDDKDSLQNVVRSSRYRLVARKDDKLPRELSIVVDIRMDVPQKLRRTLGPYAGAKIDFAFGLQKPNQDVGLR